MTSPVLPSIASQINVLVIWICILANSIKKFVRNGYVKKIGFVVSVEMPEVDISILIGGDHM